MILPVKPALPFTPAKVYPAQNGEAPALAGFTPLTQMAAPKRFLVGIDGLPDTGKTEFSLTFPPPICILFVDQGYEHIISKPIPPPNRQSAIDFKIFHLPQAGMGVAGSDGFKDNQAAYGKIWGDFYSNYIAAISSPKYRTVVRT